MNCDTINKLFSVTLLGGLFATSLVWVVENVPNMVSPVRPEFLFAGVILAVLGIATITTNRA